MMTLRACSAALLLAATGLAVGGCEVTVTETESLQGSSDSLVQDDVIDDKHPVYDETLTVVEDHEGCLVTLNKSGSVTRLDVAPFTSSEADLEGRIFPGRGEAIEALAGHYEARLIPSLEVVNGLMKPFNDGLYAAVELGVQAGEGGLLFGKRAFLADLLAAVVEAGDGASGAAAEHLDAAAVFVAAGLIAGGAEPELPADLLADAQAAADEFAASELFSRPIGFYDWNDELRGIFSQDRFYQNYGAEQEPYADAQVGLFAALAVVLEGDPDLLDRYESLLALYAGLTNPYFHHPVTDLLPYVDGLASLDDAAAIGEALIADHPLEGALSTCWPRLALLPSSDSPETELFRDLYCDDAPPADTNFIEVLIARIQDGTVDLTPAEDSGWYDYQLHALETLLLPGRGAESDHLLLTKTYKEKLVETFRSIITQNRETHAKQLDIGAVGVAAPPPDLVPLFRVEPFPTYYLRSARAYRFLAVVLEAALGEEFLATQPRLFDGEALEAPVGDELRRMTSTLYGLYFLSAASVGIRPELLPEELAELDQDECVAQAEAFLEGWTTDEEVLVDPRVIVPVERDELNGQVVYWAVIGVRVTKVNASFVEGYLPEVIASDCDGGSFADQDYYLLGERMVEVRLSADTPPPTRAELRELCDAHGTEADIVAALEAL